MTPPVREIPKPPWGHLKILSVPQKVRAVLYITKLHLMFESSDDEVPATRGFQGEAP